MNIAGHYTKGRGYYEQFRTADDLADYGIDPVVIGMDTLTSSDLIRRRWLDNDFVGGVFSFSHRFDKSLNLVFGGAANTYIGDHFGEIVWARLASNSEIMTNTMITMPKKQKPALISNWITQSINGTFMETFSIDMSVIILVVLMMCQVI